MRFMWVAYDHESPEAHTVTTGIKNHPSTEAVKFYLEKRTELKLANSMFSSISKIIFPIW